jgi:hypothetical protein
VAHVTIRVVITGTKDHSMAAPEHRLSFRVSVLHVGLVDPGSAGLVRALHRHFSRLVVRPMNHHGS